MTAPQTTRPGSRPPVTLPVMQGQDICCDAGTEPLMPFQQASSLADLLKAIADPTRVRLLDHLAAVPGGTVCACHLPGQLGISQPTLSHHLKKLVDAGILTREQRGRWAHYTVVPAALAGVTAFLRAASVGSLGDPTASTAPTVATSNLHPG